MDLERQELCFLWSDLYQIHYRQLPASAFSYARRRGLPIADDDSSRQELWMVRITNADHDLGAILPAQLEHGFRAVLKGCSDVQKASYF